MRDFRKLDVWQKSHDLAMHVHIVTKQFPKEEIYGLTSPTRRSATSVPMNISEGCGRDSVLDFRRFLSIAAGSASELEYQILLARDLEYLNQEQFERLTAKVIEVRRMLAALIRKLKADG